MGITWLRMRSGTTCVRADRSKSDLLWTWGFVEVRIHAIRVSILNELGSAAIGVP